MIELGDPDPMARPRPEIAIALEHVTKRYGATTVLDDLSMEIPKGLVTILLGPSGCGKTTTLKLLNGLVVPTSGRIAIEGRDLSALDPVALRRRIGYVIQDVGLFPHFRVFDNIALVPRLVGWERDRVDRKVHEMMTLLRLPETLLLRFPRELSGGQRQRVGVARALAAEPDILLMDEPFGAVDPVNRSRIVEDFGQIQAKLGTTVVMVTHALDEALALGHRIAMLEDGKLVQFDAPGPLIAHPASEAVAEFLTSQNALRRLADSRLQASDG